MVNIAYVSVNQSYVPGMSGEELALNAHAAWPISLAKAEGIDVVVAVLEGQPLMAWPSFGAYMSRETYETNGGPRPRIAFAMGMPVPVDPAWHQVPELRRGIATAEF